MHIVRLTPLHGCRTWRRQTDKRWTIHPKMEEMKAKAKAQGLWNLWISPSLADCMREVVAESSEPGLLGAGLSNLVGVSTLSSIFCHECLTLVSVRA